MSHLYSPCSVGAVRVHIINLARSHGWGVDEWALDKAASYPYVWADQRTRRIEWAMPNSPVHVHGTQVDLETFLSLVLAGPRPAWADQVRTVFGDVKAIIRENGAVRIENSRSEGFTIPRRAFQQLAADHEHLSTSYYE